MYIKNEKEKLNFNCKNKNKRRACKGFSLHIVTNTGPILMANKIYKNP